MDLSKRDIKILKGVAILFMLLLHLFCRKDVNGLYDTFLTINGTPLIYYLALFGDACVPIYCFSSGYGLFTITESSVYNKNNLSRIFKLLVNYWIVLVFFVAIGFLTGKSEYPGSLQKFLLNFFVVSYSYNGAWWFLQTYIILVFSVPVLFKLMKKYHSVIIFAMSCAVYIISYILRFRNLLEVNGHPLLNMFFNAIVLAGTSQLTFVVGSIFAKEKIYLKLHQRFYNIPFKNILCFAGILLLVIVHALYQSMIIAPFTGAVFICLFSLMDKHISLQRTLNFFGNHSTNIWLTHMFFYLSIFSEITFAPRYPVLIFSWLILLCLTSSYVINFIYEILISTVDKKIHRWLPGGVSGL